MHLTSLPHCLSEKGVQEPFESIFVFVVTSTLLDRGWSMKLSSTVFFLLFAIALTRADNKQIQQLCVNAATCLLAVRSGLSPGRKSDLQMHRTPLAFGDHRSCSGQAPAERFRGESYATNEDRALFGPIF
jgi:hypothetical protein